MTKEKVETVKKEKFTKDDVFVKIRKNDIWESKHSMVNLLMAYFYFKKDICDDVTTSISVICEETGLSTRNGPRSPQAIIKCAISDLLLKGAIELKPRESCKTFNDIKMINSFVIHLNFDKYLSFDESFVKISLSEFNTLRLFTASQYKKGVENRTDKVFDLFVYIKQYMNLQNKIPICYINSQKIMKDNSLNEKDYRTLMKILLGSGLLYETQFGKKFTVNYTQIDNVYTLKNFSKEDITNFLRKNI